MEVVTPPSLTLNMCRLKCFQKSRKLFTFVSNELPAGHLTPDHHFHFHPLISFLAQEFSKSAAVDLDRFLPSEKPGQVIVAVKEAKFGLKWDLVMVFIYDLT